MRHLVQPIVYVVVISIFLVILGCNGSDGTSPETTSPSAQSDQTQTNIPSESDESMPGNETDQQQTPSDNLCQAGDPAVSTAIYSHQIFRAFSSDGYNFQPENKLLLDHASVPDGVLGPQGQVRVYFVNGEPGKHGIFYAEESANGNWEIKDCIKIDNEFNGDAVDPDIVRLPDGRYRLFFFLGYFVTPAPKPEPLHTIYSAISNDGVHFILEGEMISVEAVTDPSVVQLPDGTWLMALLQGGQNQTLLAASSDGYHFELTGISFPTHGIPELAVFDDGVRLYLENSYLSTDNGKTWIQEPQRFIPGPDPSLVALPDGTYIMFYKQFANTPDPDDSSASQPSEPATDIAVTIASQPTHLGLIPDARIRVDQANLPNAGMDPDSGQVYLYGNYTQTHPTHPGEPFRGISSDGIVFQNIEILTGPQDQQDFSFDSRNTLLPDGTFRRYQYIDGDTVVTSLFSSDGKYFRTESGIRYTLQEKDYGWMGVRTFFFNRENEVIMVYLGDKYGLNNARMAVSTDNGVTFAFEKSNVFGDEIMGGERNSFVDPAKLLLTDGRVRIFTMRQGHIYSFISTDDSLKNFAFEGLQISPSDFTEISVVGFFDPKPILLPDGRIRIYMTAQIQDSEGNHKQAIVSATTIS